MKAFLHLTSEAMSRPDQLCWSIHRATYLVEHGQHGLGHALSDCSLVALYDGGAHAIHLMTVAGNTKANQFWEHQWFVRAADVQFLEFDL